MRFRWRIFCRVFRTPVSFKCFSHPFLLGKCVPDLRVCFIHIVQRFVPSCRINFCWQSVSFATNFEVSCFLQGETEMFGLRTLLVACVFAGELAAALSSEPGIHFSSASRVHFCRGSVFQCRDLYHLVTSVFAGEVSAFLQTLRLQTFCNCADVSGTGRNLTSFWLHLVFKRKSKVPR